CFPVLPLMQSRASSLFEAKGTYTTKIYVKIHMSISHTLVDVNMHAAPTTHTHTHTQEKRLNQHANRHTHTHTHTHPDLLLPQLYTVLSGTIARELHSTL